MPDTKFTMTTNSDGFKVLQTPNYTVTENGFKPLIEFVHSSGELPSDRSIPMTGSLIEKIISVYGTVRFYNSFLKYNDHTIEKTYKIYKILMAPILEQLETLKALKLIKYTNDFDTMLNIRVNLFRTSTLIDSWRVSTNLKFPIAVPTLYNAPCISNRYYQYMQTKEFIDIHITCREQLKDLRNAHAELITKINDHNNNIKSNLLEKSSTSHGIFTNAPPEYTAEYKALRLAVDTARAIMINGNKGLSTLHHFYEEDSLKHIYDNNKGFAVELVINDEQDEELNVILKDMPTIMNAMIAA